MCLNSGKESKPERKFRRFISHLHPGMLRVYTSAASWATAPKRFTAIAQQELPPPNDIEALRRMLAQISPEQIARRLASALGVIPTLPPEFPSRAP